MRCHLNKRELFKKTIAWILIATTVNPTFMAPAFARDSDIYLASTTGTSTAEPNVLFILGTNDRMNVAEAWREYDPLVYDSHAEYLWNDINIINNGAEIVAENANAISTAAPPTNPFSASISPICVGTPSARPPRAAPAANTFRCFSVSSQASALRLATTTLAPAQMNPSAIARPIPRVPPVTMAVRPVRSNNESNFCESMG